jgi:class 3 adenylate cyclase
MPPYACLVANPDSPDASEIAIYDRLFVGREVSGVNDHQRLVVDDVMVSRNHLEIRVEPEHAVAYVVDTSTNGTRLNGVRIERGVPTVLRPGDRITVGLVQFEFRSDALLKQSMLSARQTTAQVTNSDFVMVVGDIVGFSTSSRNTPSRLVMESLESLLREFRTLLTGFHGTLSNFVGDAFFAIWAVGFEARAPFVALDFVTAAARRVSEVAPTLALRAADGEPLRMGWGVALGDAAVSTLTGVLLGVVGDATNLAFRLSGIAARSGHSEVLVADSLYRLVADHYPFEPMEYVNVKGRAEAEAVHGLRAPFTSANGS